MASAIVWRSCRSDTGSPDERSFSTLGPKIAFSSSALLVLKPFIKAVRGLVRGGEARPVRRGRRCARGQQEQHQAQPDGQHVKFKAFHAGSPITQRSPTHRHCDPRLTAGGPPPPPRLALPLALWLRALRHSGSHRRSGRWTAGWTDSPDPWTAGWTGSPARWTAGSPGSPAPSLRFHRSRCWLWSVVSTGSSARWTVVTTGSSAQWTAVSTDWLARSIWRCDWLFCAVSWRCALVVLERFPAVLRVVLAIVHVVFPPLVRLVVRRSTAAPRVRPVVVVVGGTPDDDARREADHRRGGGVRRRRRGRLLHVDDLRVVDRDVDHLGVGGLDEDDRLPGGGGFRHHLLLRRGLQVAEGHRRRAQALDGLVDGGLIAGECCAELPGPVRLLHEHLDHLRERRQRDVAGCEPRLLRGVLELGSLEGAVALQPAGELLHSGEILRRLQDLRDQGIRVERDRCEQVVERPSSTRLRAWRPRPHPAARARGAAGATRW